MANYSMSYPGHKGRKTTPIHDQIQIALAVADEVKLKSLVANCYPPMICHDFIGKIFSEIGVPVKYKQSADAIITFENVWCVPAHPEEKFDDRLFENQEEFIRRFEDYDMSLEDVESLLAISGLTPKQVQEILQLPRLGVYLSSATCWHESWWYMRDSNGRLTIPFLRKIRIVDTGFKKVKSTFTIQHSNYCKLPPQSLRGEEQKVLIEIKTEIQSFGEVMEQINRYRKWLGIDKAILICDTVSDLEAEGFISQGISIYPAKEFVMLAHNC